METTTVTPSLDTFAARLALVRWTRSMNMKEASLACGIAPATWREWEMHGKLPRDYIATCRAISDALEVDPMWLITGPEVREPAGYGQRPPAQSIMAPFRWLSAAA